MRSGDLYISEAEIVCMLISQKVGKESYSLNLNRADMSFLQEAKVADVNVWGGGLVAGKWRSECICFKFHHLFILNHLTSVTPLKTRHSNISCSEVFRNGGKHATPLHVSRVMRRDGDWDFNKYFKIE